MSVLIDTNVISDVIHADPKWESWAETQILEHFGTLIINPIIFSELSCRAGSVEELEATLHPFDFHFLELPREALFLSGHAFMKYRKRGGTKTSTLPDFFIGAHASVLKIPVLTRDVGRYRTYFPEVTLISP